MSRKTSGSHQGWNDVIGVALLLLIALPLFVAQVSFDRNDLSFLHEPPNKPAHNWIGPMGAHVAYDTFFIFGLVAYLVPVFITLLGCGFIFSRWPYLREWRIHLNVWSAVFIISLAGLFDRLSRLLHPLWVNIGAPGAGGWVGITMYDFKLFGYDWGAWVLGSIGATIVYAAICLISLLFLTNFRLSDWIRALIAMLEKEKVPVVKPSKEDALQERARDLEKQAKQLQEQVARSGLGADMQPVPEPTVRDLSVPQAKGPRIRKTTMPDATKTPEPAPAEEDAIIPAREIAAAATTEEILGKKPEEKAPEKTEEAKPDEAGKETGEKSDTEKTEKPDEEKNEPKPEPEVKITGIAPLKPKPKKPKPIAVAQTPMIGNYQLPSLDFLQLPDMNVKPTESKEELMANARLMQQTLAQFDIEVSLGDITKGPTITRYELHPAPGVKLEKITALSNNIAAVLKAERIHILAPCARMSLAEPGGR